VSAARLSFIAGVGLGLLTPVLVILLLARGLTIVYDGLDGDGSYGIAVVGTRELAAALDRYRGQYHHIPDARDGLTKLAPEFLPSVDRDPWGHAYIYDPSGANQNGLQPDISTTIPNNGGRIGNWSSKIIR
jgi:hypothetical protein